MKPPKLLRITNKKSIRTIKTTGLLLGASVRLPCSCNFKCVYCYSKNDKEKLFHNDILSFLDQTIKLGAKSVSFVGEGEPFLYKSQSSLNDKKTNTLIDIIEYLDKRNVQSIIYTNTSLITHKIAEVLFAKNVVIVAKKNAISADIQNKLTGKETYNKICDGIEILKRAGFNRDSTVSRLSIHTVITKLNYDEIPFLWTECREQHIMPQVQILVTPEKLKNLSDLQVSPIKIKDLFERLSHIDREKFGLVWEPRPPIAPWGCNSIYTSCALRPNGDISICAYTDIILGNIFNASLKDILSSNIVKKIRNVDEHIKEDCKTCDMKKKYFCYGCRAHQISLSSDFFDSYDFCWKHKS